MSGILAVLHRNAKPVPVPVLEAMLAASQDRAVDGHGVWLRGHVALANQRFYVAPEDLDECQPLVSETGLTVLSCDARLDNRDDLLAALGLASETGRVFSDAALILRSYERWGTGCVERLLGDFAFTIWDSREQQLFVATDALGARSLCIYVDQNHCLVASEISSILAHQVVQPKLNESRVGEFLANVWDNHKDTYYEGVDYLPPAHCLLVKADSMRIWRYWDVDPSSQIRYRSDGEYAEHYLALLTEAIRCRLRSTGGVGLSLSGGLDSTALAALTSTLLGKAGLSQERLKSFSYTFDELESCDEREYIQPVVDRYQLDATYIPGDDMWTLRHLPQWPADRGFVLSDPYAWLPRAVMGAAQQAGCRAIMTGHYGDVLFAGSQYWAADMIGDLRFRELGRILWDNPRSAPWRTGQFNFALRALVPQRVRKTYRLLSPAGVGTLHPALDPGFVKRADLHNRVNRQHDKWQFPTLSKWARYRSLTLGVFSQGAAAIRKVYNRHGLELLTPYWDRRLVEFVMSVPSDQLGRTYRKRWLHRNAMRDLLPEHVRERQRQTVYVDLFEKGLLQKEKSAVRQLLRNPQIVQRQMVSARWLEEALTSESVLDPDWAQLWLCISLELWLQRYW